MPTPICVKCRVEMRCAKNSFIVRDPEAGGFPSTYWASDKWACPVCGCEIVTGFSRSGHDSDSAKMLGWTDKDFEAGEEALEFRYNP